MGPGEWGGGLCWKEGGGKAENGMVGRTGTAFHWATPWNQSRFMVQTSSLVGGMHTHPNLPCRR